MAIAISSLSRQSMLFGSLVNLISSLLLSTMTSQYCEASSRNMKSTFGELDTSGAQRSVSGSDKMTQHSDAAVQVTSGHVLRTTNETLLEKLLNVTDDDSPAIKTDDLAKDSAMIGAFRTDDNALQASSSTSQQLEQLCVYTIVTQTGKQDGAGTDSDISVHLSNRRSNEVYFQGLANGHRTFERGHKDTFVIGGRPCVWDICKMVLRTDDYGSFSEWFVVSLGFSVALVQDGGAPEQLIIQESRWEINEWLPEEDEAEELYTIRDDCNP